MEENYNCSMMDKDNLTTTRTRNSQRSHERNCKLIKELVFHFTL